MTTGRLSLRLPAQGRQTRGTDRVANTDACEIGDALGRTGARTPSANRRALLSFYGYPTYNQ